MLPHGLGPWKRSAAFVMQSPSRLSFTTARTRSFTETRKRISIRASLILCLGVQQRLQSTHHQQSCPIRHRPSFSKFDHFFSLPKLAENSYLTHFGHPERIGRFLLVEGVYQLTP